MVMICLRSFLRHFLGNWDNDGIYIASCFSYSNCLVVWLTLFTDNWFLKKQQNNEMLSIVDWINHSESFWMAWKLMVFFLSFHVDYFIVLVPIFFSTFWLCINLVFRQHCLYNNIWYIGHNRYWGKTCCVTLFLSHCSKTYPF